MAAIDDKISDLNFSIVTSRTSEQIMQAAADAAEIASAGGEKTTLTATSADRISGSVRNFVRMEHASFTVAIDHTGENTSRVTLTIDDYLRTRSTLLYFIPVSPWSAPAYKTLKAFSDYLRSRI